MKHFLSVLMGLLLCLAVWGQAEADLVLHWSMDTIVNEGGWKMIIPDESGNGNYGVIWRDDGLPNWPLLTTDAVKGKALVLDGIDDYIQSDGTETGLLKGDITVEAWVKSADPFGDVVTNVKNDGFHLFLDAGSYRLQVIDNDGVIIDSDSQIGDHWYNVVAIYDEFTQEMAVYVNGIKAIHGWLLPGDIDDNYRVTVGRGAWSADSFLNGTVDEVKIYNEVLSAEDILANYEKTILEKTYNDGYRDGLLSTDPVGEILNVLPPGIRKNLLNDRGFAK